ncbi:MAG TPA: 4Fe-4S binding protein [Sulfuricaulis sp.]|nr:4Fe-4S binding protein [Sulfuricaulis sp.]
MGASPGENPEFTLAETTADGRARRAALAAMREVAVTPTSAVAYRSTGAVAVIGPPAEALAAAARLSPPLRCTVLVQSDAGSAPTTDTRAAASDVPVLHEKVIQVTGHLGQFAVIVAAATPGGAMNLLQKLESPWTHFDLVLDLTDPPFLRYELPPPGYYAPGGDATALERAVAELQEMVGEFEKPRFFRYNPDICAHGESGLTGCTRCLDACPTNAIISMRDEVSVDPYLCQGAGLCATVCPTGAMTYVYPTVADQLQRLAAVIKAYYADAGTRPVLLLYDAESGRERLAALAPRLPGNVIPFELAELGSLGMDAWLSVLAYGAECVALLPGAPLLRSVAGAVSEQVVFAGAILEGMGYPASLIRLIEGDDQAVLNELAAIPVRRSAPRATFAGIDEKRTLLRLAIEHLHAVAPAPRAAVPLPEGAPFGEILIDRAACTLCMSCVSVCPAGALADGGDLPQLNFIEANCVQCGLCQTACPESAIRLAPRYLYGASERRRARVLNQEEPFYCVVCGKPFATRKLMDRMTQKLQGHWMYQGAEALRRVQMCGDCRVREVFRADAKRREGVE